MRSVLLLALFLTACVSVQAAEPRALPAAIQPRTSLQADNFAPTAQRWISELGEHSWAVTHGNLADADAAQTALQTLQDELRLIDLPQPYHPISMLIQTAIDHCLQAKYRMENNDLALAVWQRACTESTLDAVVALERME